MSRIIRNVRARIVAAGLIAISAAVMASATQPVSAEPDASAAAGRCPRTTNHPERQFPNPLHRCPTADPGMWRVGEHTWYSYSTGGDRSHGVFPIRKSVDDRKTWTNAGHILRPGHLPDWIGSPSQYWAPQASAIDGRYVAYFAAIDKQGRFSVGTATADNPEGPWAGQNQPLVSNKDFSVIDPYFFRDPVSKKNYLLWKDNLNPQHKPTHIVIHEISANGLRLLGQSHRILVNDQGWEGDVVEAPSMEYRNGYYYLFYSGNTFSSGRYAVGVARSTSPTGGFHKYEHNPILHSNSRFTGPGGQDVVRGPGGEWLMFYHADPTFGPFANDNKRYLMMDRIAWSTDNWPHINDGTPGN